MVSDQDYYDIDSMNDGRREAKWSLYAFFLLYSYFILFFSIFIGATLYLLFSRHMREEGT